MRKRSVVSLILFFTFTLICSYHPVWAVSEPNSVHIHFEGYSLYDYSNGKNWHYCQLKSEDGTEISLDYQICPFSWGYPHTSYARSLNRNVSAQKIWINVRNKHFTGSENVNVVFINKYIDRTWRYYESTWGLQENVSQIRLNPIFDEHKFTASLDNVFITPLINYNLVHEPNWQEVAIEVDGKWLKDPISQTNNFRIDLLYPVKK